MENVIQTRIDAGMLKEIDQFLYKDESLSRFLIKAIQRELTFRYVVLEQNVVYQEIEKISKGVK